MSNTPDSSQTYVSDTASPDTGSKKNLYIGLGIGGVIFVGLAIGLAFAFWPKSPCIKKCGTRCNIDDGCGGQCSCMPGRDCDANNNCVTVGNGTPTTTSTGTSTGTKKPHGSGTGTKKPHGSGTSTSTSTGTSTSSGKSTNTSIIITGQNGLNVTYTDPEQLVYGKGDYQHTMGCWSLDTDDNWKRALKDGSYCRVKSITLPPDITAKSFTTTGAWGDICSDTFIEQIPAGSTDYAVKSSSKGTPPCGFLFEKVKSP
jgi:hypothetical protein